MTKTLSIFTPLAALCVAAVSPVQAQGPSVEDKVLMTLNLGPTFGKLASTDEKAEGSQVNFTFERFFTENVSLGFNLGYLTGLSQAADSTVTSYWSLPSAVTLRYMFGRSVFRPYIGFGMGVFYSKSTEDFRGATISEWGLNTSAPIGFLLFLDPRVYLNLNWMPTVTTQNLFKDGFVHAINFGMGSVF